MNKKIKFSLLLLSFALTPLLGCAQHESEENLTLQAKNNLLVDRHCFRVGRQLAKTNKLYFNRASGSVHSGVDGNHQIISFEYRVPRSLTQKEARVLIANCIETIQSEFNHNVEMEGSIPDKGYQVDDIILHLIVQPAQKKESHTEIAFVTLSHGKITFKANDPDKSLISETWAEALAQLDQIAD